MNIPYRDIINYILYFRFRFVTMYYPTFKNDKNNSFKQKFSVIIVAG